MDRNLPELARVVSHTWKEDWDTDGDRMRPVLVGGGGGIQGGNIRDKQGVEAWRAKTSPWIILIASPVPLSETWWLGTVGC